jgi:hypothetical protein
MLGLPGTLSSSIAEIFDLGASMATNAEIAARLLRDAAGFFRSVGEQNPPLKEHMSHNAQAFEVMADRVETDPTGEANFAQAAESGGDTQQS